MGIKEWLNYPSPAGIELFKISSNVHWDPNEPVRAITKTDIFSYLHEFEFEYKRWVGDDKPFTSSSMTSFIMALFDLSRKYVVKDEEEDI